MTGHTSTESMYAITLHQPWASLIALGIKTVETRSWPAPALLVGQTIAIHAGKRVVRQPGENIEQELRARLGEDWHGDIPAGRVVATAILVRMARVAHINPLTGHAVHDLSTETGCAVGLGRLQSRPLAVASRRGEAIARASASCRPSILLALERSRCVTALRRADRSAVASKQETWM